MMYTITYMIRYTIFLLVFIALLQILLRASGVDRIAVTCTLILYSYLIFFSHAFSSWMRTPTSMMNRPNIPIPIGTGWSFYLNKIYASPKLLTTRHMNGLQSNGRWGAGTLIKEIQSFYKKRNQSLSSYPSVENGTIGGWVASGSHGSGGTLWKPNFGKITVKDLEKNTIMDVNYNDIFHRKASIQDCRKYLILDVEVNPHPNHWCKKIILKILSVEDCHEFLTTPTYLRMLQIGKRGIMALLWTPLPEEDMNLEHVEPKFGSQLSLWVQADVLSKFQSSSARDKDWFDFPVALKDQLVSRIQLADANSFTFEPPIALTPIGLAFINFEVFVLDFTIDDALLFKLSNEISDLFTRDIQGRCELRGGNKILFLDFVILRHCKYVHIFNLLFNVLGPVKIALHRGKAQVDTFPFLLT